MTAKIANLWGEEILDGNYFECYDTTIWDVMENVIKVTHKMNEVGVKTSFRIIGKCASAWDCIIFTIEFDGNEPRIKSSWAEPDSYDEDLNALYFEFCSAEYDDIPGLLKDNKSYTFEDAFNEEIPLGGFLDVSYDEWIESILQ